MAAESDEPLDPLASPPPIPKEEPALTAAGPPAAPGK
jgi:hypothetical protein